VIYCLTRRKVVTVSVNPLVRIELSDSDSRLRDKINGNFNVLARQMSLSISDQRDVIGLLNHTGTARPGFDDATVSAASMRVPAASAPTEVTWNTVLKKWSFAATGSEYLYIEGLQLTHRYESGSDLLWHVHFIPVSSIPDGATVIFRFRATTAPVWGKFGSTVAIDTTFTNDAATRSLLPAASLSGTTILADTHMMTTSTVIDGSGLGRSSLIEGRLERLSADTFTGAVLLGSADAHIHVNRLGSDGE
jgi:hypothetical protein